jgi:hypothetical protein
MSSIIHITNIGITAGFISLLYAKLLLNLPSQCENTYESKTAHSTQNESSQKSVQNFTKF